MNIGLVGYGYWGKIIHSNLKTILSGDVITIFDPIEGIGNMDDIYLCDKVFVVTPTITHFEIVKDLLSNGIDVFCEKPLSTHTKECELLYSIAKENKAELFVDWIFTFNDAIEFIKKQYEAKEYGNIRSVRMNRLNSGPERKDVSAKWDLSSHDVSILCYVFEELPLKLDWHPYKRNKNSFVSDTCVGILQYKKFDAILHSSWEYGKKDRKCIFEFDAGFLTWDDVANVLKFNGDILDFPKTKSPLECSINKFIDGQFNQEKLTMDVVGILEYGE
jgi:predicted dehydrogenase